ncbi:MAG TPA: FeoA family protein [Kiritimatiellia bacterium]|nr:FeoA family protein [Kiritimatiellia bacterium]HMP98074.1 FeoA family protein [Kiritimatiellia bacterium]
MNESSSGVDSATVFLHQLLPHQCGVVEEVLAPDSDLERLMAMGVCGGRTVELIHVGDPLILKVYGTRIGLSARLAEKIKVKPCGLAGGRCALAPERLP